MKPSFKFLAMSAKKALYSVRVRVISDGYVVVCRCRCTETAGWKLLSPLLGSTASGSLTSLLFPTDLRYSYNISFCLLTTGCVCVLQDYYIILDTNLPSHFYRFTRPEASVSGSEDSHITLTFNVQVTVYLYVIVMYSLCSNETCYKMFSVCVI